MKLLLLVILFIIFFPIVKMWMLMRRARRNVEDIFNRTRQYEQEVASDEKRIPKEVGEYADYEEVRGVSRPEAEASSPVEHEEQVVDADFEDI